MTRESNVSIRRCGPDDWRDLRAIRLEALADTPDAYGSTYEDTVSWSDAQWKDAATNQLYYLADRDGRVVGMVSGGFNDTHPGTRWLYGMYVTPSERGTGMASLLVDAIGDWATSEGVDEVFLHVTSSVPRARAFYEKIGFRPNGESFAMQRDESLTLITLVRSID
ncbi:MAG TPA: GNAT family N-acetyltransferase [Acidimicrobiales bacterium]|nr:GNAT family N-acetyltransferase [Acidimicrobiales bacterium]